jgi:hypothetical protein
MKTILLPAGLSSDLDWSAQREQALQSDEVILWEMDFCFPSTLCNDQAAFNSYILAAQQFCQLWKEFSDRSKGVVLYRGSLDIIRSIDSDEVEAANIFGDLLHRLASFLPDEAAPFCLFEGTSFSKAKSAQLMSKERFWHLYLSLKENQSSRGVLLPSDEYCTPEVLEKLEKLLAVPCRIIPEKRLNEMWDGLDRLDVIEEAVSPVGKRHLMGFIAAGGEVFGAEGFEPPTHCSQSSCASQTALCSERAT